MWRAWVLGEVQRMHAVRPSSIMAWCDVHRARQRTLRNTGRTLAVHERRRCGLDYARGGGSSGGNVAEGGVSTTIAIARDGTSRCSAKALACDAMSAVMHGPMAWQIGMLCF